ncbi:hypothetical protein FRC07_011308 [Ceratobasidium sp. 392]|nr:hypothetical protein FRC07_011308 [Ceratobasidium sp. 392]
MIPTAGYIDVDAPIHIDVDEPIHIDVDALDAARDIRNNAASTPAGAASSKASTSDSFLDLNVAAPSATKDRQYTDVNEFDSHFFCPLCYVWEPSGDARAVKLCGHVFCVTGWGNWCRSCARQGIAVSCPICRVDVNPKDTVDVEFQAAKFHSEDTLVREIGRRTASLNEDTACLKERMVQMSRVMAAQQEQLREMERGLEEISRFTNTGGSSDMQVD